MGEPRRQERDERPFEHKRVPPNDLNAEAAVISTMFLDKGSIDKLVTYGFLPEHCYADANRRIVEVIYAMRQEAREIDVVTVAAELRSLNRLHQIGGAPYLGQLADATPFVANVLEHAKIVMEAWRVRRVIEICQRQTAVGYEPVEDVQAYLEEVEKQVSEIAHIRRSQKVELVGEVFVREVNRITRAKEAGEEPTLGVKTGLRELDKMTSGLIDGNLYIIAARPGMGKTALVTNLLLNISKPVAQEGPRYVSLLASLEMTREQIALRFASQESFVDVPTLASGRATREQWGHITAAGSVLNRTPIFIDDTPAMSLLEFHATVRQLKRKVDSGELGDVKLGCVAVDYLQLMAGVRHKGDSREQEVSSLSRGLKEIAKSESVPVIALSQLNRAVEKTKDKRPTLADLRESGAIEQDADSIFFIYRESYYFKENTDKRGIAEIIIAKQRNGPTGYFETKFTESVMRFDNLAVEQDFDEFDGYWDNT